MVFPSNVSGKYGPVDAPEILSFRFLVDQFRRLAHPKQNVGPAQVVDLDEYLGQILRIGPFLELRNGPD